MHVAYRVKVSRASATYGTPAALKHGLCSILSEIRASQFRGEDASQLIEAHMMKTLAWWFSGSHHEASHMLN